VGVYSPQKHQWTLIYMQDPLIPEISAWTCMCRVIKCLQGKWNNICSYCHSFTHCALRCGRFGSSSKWFIWQIIYVKMLISNNHIIYIVLYIRKQTVYFTTSTTTRRKTSSVLCLLRHVVSNCTVHSTLTLNLLTTTIVAPPSNASKWQMGFNSAFKGLKILKWHIYIYIAINMFLFWTKILNQNMIVTYIYVDS
jgi:hypothetical protein